MSDISVFQRDSFADRPVESLPLTSTEAKCIKKERNGKNKQNNLGSMRRAAK